MDSWNLILHVGASALAKILQFLFDSFIKNFQGDETRDHDDGKDLEATDGVAEDDPGEQGGNHRFQEKKVVGA